MVPLRVKRCDAIFFITVTIATEQTGKSCAVEAINERPMLHVRVNDDDS